LEDLFKNWASYLALIVEGLAAIFIAIGAAAAIAALLKLPQAGRRREVALRFGVWLRLSLEFQLGADIIRTAISPTWTQIGQLGAIAVIRTFLNYFLERDMQDYEAAGGGRPVPTPADKAA
jgi:uncharacterized membrane protein